MRILTPGVSVCAALLICSLSTSRSITAGAQTKQIDTTSAPRLLVIVVVDQMRAQYLEDYGPLFTAGIGRP
jgi:predicted AlkP superfamily pyrophosphatase or phosphodiesterase